MAVDDPDEIKAVKIVNVPMMVVVANKLHLTYKIPSNTILGIIEPAPITIWKLQFVFLILSNSELRIIDIYRLR